MQLPGLWPWLTIGALSIVAAARECNNENSSYILNAPEDIATYFDGCTSITADRISISNSYAGPFILPSVVNITGTLFSRHGVEVQTMLARASISSFEAPDLRFLGGLELEGVSDMKNVSFPVLEIVKGQVHIDSSSENLDIAFPALRSAGSLTIRADFNFNGPDLTSLETVANDLVVEYCPYCSPPYAERSVVFPALVSAGYLHLEGSIMRIRVPFLTFVGPPAGGNGISTDSGIRLELEHMQSSEMLRFRKLTSVDKQLYIHGGISYLWISRLKSTSAHIHIDSNNISEMSMGLVNATSIEILGGIEKIYLSSLTHVTNLTIDSDMLCEDIHHNLEDLSSAHFNCRSHPPLSGKEKAAVGIAIMGGTVIITIFGFVIYKRLVRRKARKVVTTTELVDLPGTVDDVARLRVRSAEPPRPETPPPPYSPSPT